MDMSTLRPPSGQVNFPPVSLACVPFRGGYALATGGQ